MRTTTVIGELLIIGIQFLFLFALCVLPIDILVKCFDIFIMQSDVTKIPNILTLTIIFIPICYTFGVVFDRVSDMLLSSITRRRDGEWRQWMAPLPVDYKGRAFLFGKIAAIRDQDERMIVLAKEGAATGYLDYLRGPIRILRATVVAISFSFLVISKFLYFNVVTSALAITAIFLGLAFLYVTFNAWVELEHSFHHRIRSANEALDMASTESE